MDENKVSKRESVLDEKMVDNRVEHNAELLLESKEERNRVNEIVAKAPPELQEIFELHFLRGIKFSDIAKLKGVTKSTISKRFTRLKEFVEKEILKSDK